MTRKNDWFHDGWAFHFRKWWGFNEEQADFAVHTMTSACAAIVGLSIPLLFWKLIGLLCLISAIWCCSRVYALRTIPHSAAGRTGPATPAKHSPRAVAQAPAADTPRRSS